MNNTMTFSSVKLLAPAKINLTLDILGKDDRVGKHFVNTIAYKFQSLADEIELASLEIPKVILQCDDPRVPIDESNTILQALRLLNVTGWQIRLTKKIPMQSGLGGGSSNAAAVVKYFGLKKGMGIHQLEEIGRQIGADVPLFLQDENLIYCEGYGDQVVQSWDIQPLPVKLLETGIQVGTSEAYSKIDLDLCGRKSAQTELLLKKLQSSPELTPDIWEHFVHNDFESSFFEKYPKWSGRGSLCGSGGMLWFFSAPTPGSTVPATKKPSV